jgi:hypothetical protein
MLEAGMKVMEEGKEEGKEGGRDIIDVEKTNGKKGKKDGKNNDGNNETTQVIYSFCEYSSLFFQNPPFYCCTWSCRISWRNYWKAEPKDCSRKTEKWLLLPNQLLLLILQLLLLLFLQGE